MSECFACEICTNKEIKNVNGAYKGEAIPTKTKYMLQKCYQERHKTTSSSSNFTKVKDNNEPPICIVKYTLRCVWFNFTVLQFYTIVGEKIV